MKKLITGLCILLFSISVHADQALSKSLIKKYVASTEEVDMLAEKYPVVNQQLEDLMTLDKKEVITSMKSSGAYSKIQSAIASYGFNDVEAYLDIGYRIMGAVYKSQLQQMPDSASLDTYVEQMRQQIDAMKERGMPKEALAEMEASIEEQLSSMEFMKKAAASASEEDVKFVNENMAWIMSVMPAE
ncbi:hypothetical protein [Flocculibacter collagenilyticus]|uniref:hypothetical protein n=1 Tax=Flocculibacter collagenilyticus TaxID=2744479 RepID=UPI0018F6265F|nr:hypothetical protein [Flocculibacter collagenilyticus]